MKSCGTCTRPATHQTRTGHPLCDTCTARVNAALDREYANRRPTPIHAQGALDLEAA